MITRLKWPSLNLRSVLQQRVHEVLCRSCVEAEREAVHAGRGGASGRCTPGCLHPGSLGAASRRLHPAKFDDNSRPDSFIPRLSRSFCPPRCRSAYNIVHHDQCSSSGHSHAVPKISRCHVVRVSAIDKDEVEQCHTQLKGSGDCFRRVAWNELVTARKYSVETEWSLQNDQR
ncbi:hypothetical protein, variant 2 [Aphanomyces invadans]|uniref:Uncharacterized protein n=1 Tax=Aphanomyces invadans TaxID=157072 RepID=A0A024T8J2_9STRA|nr:hypothetical protein, variant 2 [Aphanomyces invadans]ETV90309.1 hypothetical protein, variant 2 [Aphanomyces invadans]|eukprot:XP_008881036.1 hypothetical protein, variant 2 [Aphanomyces invadans]